MLFKILCIFGKILTAYSLLVTPQTVPELENDLEVYFFCRENNNTFAVNIAWMDPQEFLYIPGSLNMGNSRITAEGSRLRIVQLLRNDTGMYRCLRSNNPSDFAEATLLVHAPPAILNAMPKQDIHLGHTSLIKCEVDRGSPLAYIHWLHVQYHNETGQETLTEITNSSDPRFTIVSDGLQITNVQHSDEGIYRCYVYNSYGTVIRDIQAAIGAPPQSTLTHHSYYITLDQLENLMINCSVSAFPQPQFQWILQSSGEHFPQSSWVSTYHDQTARSTLVYTFGPLDFYGSCTTVLVCRATNGYGTSEQFFTLKLNTTLEEFCMLGNSVSLTSASKTLQTSKPHAKSDAGFEITVAASVATAALIIVLLVFCVVLILISVLIHLFRRKKR
jgi:hypothetical protein